MKNLIQTWLKIGYKNFWIRKAYDPPFNKESFYECKTLEELKSKFLVGNWSLGTAFYYQNLCFINQVDGGDEWLAIKDDVDFESLTWRNIIAKGQFESYMNKYLKSTKEQCKAWNYQE